MNIAKLARIRDEGGPDFSKSAETMPQALAKAGQKPLRFNRLQMTPEDDQIVMNEARLARIGVEAGPDTNGAPNPMVSTTLSEHEDEEFIRSLHGIQFGPLERTNRAAPETNSHKISDDSGPHVPPAQPSGARGVRGRGRDRRRGSALGFGLPSGRFDRGEQSLCLEKKEGAESEQEGSKQTKPT